MPAIEQRFSVSYEFPVIFTEGVFEPGNATLADVLRRGGRACGLGRHPERRPPSSATRPGRRVAPRRGPILQSLSLHRLGLHGDLHRKLHLLQGRGRTTDRG